MKKRTTQDVVDWLGANTPYAEVNGELIGNKIKIIFKDCGCEKVYNFNNFKNKNKGCPFCTKYKYSLQDINDIAEKYNLKFIPDALPITSRRSLKFSDNEEYIVYGNIQQIKNGSYTSKFSFFNPNILSNLNLYFSKNNIKKEAIGIKMGGKNIKNKVITKCLNCDELPIETPIGNLMKPMCPYCSGKRVTDKNRVSVQRPDLIKYFQNKLDADNVSIRSEKRFDFKCPICGFIKNMTMDKLTYYKFACDKCSDGVSIPEKLMFYILEELSINFEKQYSPTWANNKRYDFYIPSLDMIIEVHGEQHYRYTGRGRSLKEEQANDLLKYNLAIQNGIKPENYIVIDCRRSEIEWLKSNYIKELNDKFLNMRILNFEQLYLNSQKSLMVEVCNFYKDGNRIVDAINKFKLSESTITRYLKDGNKIGLCEYIPNSKFKNK